MLTHTVIQIINFPESNLSKLLFLVIKSLFTSIQLLTKVEYSNFHRTVRKNSP